MSVPLLKSDAPLLSPEAVSDEAIANGVALGGAGTTDAAGNAPPPAAGKRVNVIDPEGKSYSLPESQLGWAAKQGYTLETSEQAAVNNYIEANKGLGGATKTALRSWGDWASFGVSDAVENSGLSSLERAKKEALAKEHDIAGYLGAAGGFATSLLYGGEFFGAAGKAGTAVERGILGLGEHVAAEEVAGKAIGTAIADFASPAVAEAAQKAGPGLARQLIAAGAGHAVEGAVLSAPRAVTEAALGDPDLAAETLLYGAGGGALFGVGSALGKAGAKGVGKGIASTLRGVTDMVGQAPSLASSAGGALENEANNQTWRALNGGKKASKLAQRIEGGEAGVGKALAENDLDKHLGESMKDYAERIDKARSGVGKSIGNAYERLDGLGHPAGTGFTVDGLADHLRTEVVDKYAKKAGYGAVTDGLNSYLDDLVSKEGAGADLSFKRMSAIKQDLDGLINHEAEAKTPRAKALKELRAKLNGAILDAAETVNPEVHAELKRANKLYAQLSVAQRAATEGAERQTANRAVSLTDHLTGLGGVVAGMATGHPIGAALGVGAALGNKFLREEGNSLAARALRAVGSGEGGGIAGRVMRAAGGFEGKAGLVGIEQAMKAAAEGIDHIPSVLDALATEGAVRTGQRFELDSHGQALNDAASREHKAEAMNKLATEITRLSSDPAAMHAKLEEIVGPYAHDAPQISAAATQKATQVVRYLDDKLPKPPSVGNPFSGPVAWRPSDQQMADFERIYNAANNPLSLISRLEDHTITKAEVETVRALFPKTMEAMIQKVMEHGSSGSAKPIPYAGLSKLSTFVGSPLAPSLKYVQQFQSAFGPPKSPAGHPGSGAPHPIHANVHLPSTGTDTQRLAMKGGQ